MRSDHKETGASKKKFKYKRLGSIHVMGKYNLARFKGAALRDKIFFQVQVFFAGFVTKLRLKLSRQPLVLAHPPPPTPYQAPLGIVAIALTTFSNHPIMLLLLPIHINTDLKDILSQYPFGSILSKKYDPERTLKADDFVPLSPHQP